MVDHLTSRDATAPDSGERVHPAWLVVEMAVIAACELLLYQTEDGRTRVECRFADESLWLSQALIAELFQVTVPTVNEHLRNLYRDGELLPEATIRKFRIVRQEGTREVARQIEHYNLDATLAVGYRVRSSRGTQFRQWATERLREYLVKGFTMDAGDLAHERQHRLELATVAFVQSRERQS